MRLPFLLGIYLPTGFNPRICKRCDVGLAGVVVVPEVSIHASVKDATIVAIFKSKKHGFNPRICKRCDKREIV